MRTRKASHVAIGPGSAVADPLANLGERSIARRFVVALVAAALGMVVVATPVAANDTMCTGSLAGTHDNVVVPQGATCTFTGVTILGNLKVFTQGAVWATDSEIRGNIEATKARYVWLDGNEVGGRIWVKETGPAPDALPVWFCRNDVAGNIQIEKLTASFAITLGPGSGCPGVGGGNTVGGNLILLENFIGPTISGLNVQINTVQGNLQFFKNTGPGPKHVHANTIQGDLQCFDNAPPMSGTGNFARKAEGQCSATPLP